MFFCSAQGGKAFGAFQGDERRQSHAHQGRLFLYTGNLGCLPEDMVVDIERCSHAYEYALLEHIMQALIL